MTEYHIALIREGGSIEHHDLLGAAEEPVVPETGPWTLGDGFVFNDLDSMISVELEPFQGYEEETYTSIPGWYLLEVEFKMSDGTTINIIYWLHLPVDPGNDLELDTSKTKWRRKGKKKVGTGARDPKDKVHTVNLDNVESYTLKRVV